MGDRPVPIAAQAAAALGLPQHPIDAARAAHNKRLARERLRGAGLPVPWFASYAIDDPQPIGDRHVPLPCVLKPLVLSGSRGVIRANTGPTGAGPCPPRAPAAVARGAGTARSRCPSRAHRELHPGRRIRDRRPARARPLRVLAIFDKPDPSRTVLRRDHLRHAVARATRPGSVPSRRRWPGRERARPVPWPGTRRMPCRRRWCLRARSRGATDWRAVRARAALPDERGAVFHSKSCCCVTRSARCPRAWTREAPASGVMMIPIRHRGVYRRVDGLDAARAVPHVTDIRITAKPDQLLVPLPEGASYLGFIFARARASRHGRRRAESRACAAHVRGRSPRGDGQPVGTRHPDPEPRTLPTED